MDTNIIFSALLRSQSGFADTLLRTDHPCYACGLVLVELFRRKERIVQTSHLSEDEIVRIYYMLLRRISVYREELIAPKNWRAAYLLCRDTDESDTPHVALTLELDGLLWTGDKALKDGLKQKGFARFFEPGTRG